MKIHKKYRDRVEFISLSNDNKETVQAFSSRYSIGWVQGYGVSKETMTALGAFDPDVNEDLGGTDSEFFPAPTLYIIGLDGKVLWSDKWQRMNKASPRVLLDALEEQIEIHLARSVEVDPPSR